MSIAEGETFGQRMARLRAEGVIAQPRGRPPIAEKYKPAIEKAERVFAKALPDEAERYIDELAAKEPEECPHHHRVLRCPDPQCDYSSQRVLYDHKAAAYVFDRIMGKPTTRSENTITIQLVEQLTTAIVGIFTEVNALGDANARQAAFGARLIELGAQYGGRAS